MSRLRVGLFRSPEAFSSFSMDRYAESLQAALVEFHGARLEIHEVRLPRRLPAATTRVGAYWHRYPRYFVHAQRTRFDVNHVVDQAYGHLLFALDPARTVVTCHDIFPLKHWRGEIHGLAPRRTPLTVLASLRGLRQAGVVITPSEATKLDLMRHLGLDPAMIEVIPYGLQPEFRRFTVEERRRLRETMPLGGDAVQYLLTVDSGGPYKNQRATVEVIARLAREHGRAVRLVRAGVPLARDQRALADRLGVSELVVELGPVDRSAMPALYNRCDLLLFPSFYEGFGWPPLEAMACGLPVVCSNWASLVEVVGDAFPTIDPTEYDLLAGQALRFLDGEDAEVAVQRGTARAARFTWERAAARTAEVYERIGGVV